MDSTPLSQALLVRGRACRTSKSSDESACFTAGRARPATPVDMTKIGSLQGSGPLSCRAFPFV